MRMLVRMALLASGIDAVLLLVGLRQTALIKSNHIGPDLIDIRRMRKVHHIRRIGTGRAHVDLKARIVADLAEAAASLLQTEEFKMNETALHAERLDGAAAELAKRLRHIRADRIFQIDVIDHHIHD